MSMFLGAFLLVGCNENALDISKPPDEPGVPSLAVIPPALAWGQLTVSESEIQTFTIHNIGDAPVSVENVTIEGVQSYTILTPMGLFIERDQSAVVEVEFRPITANNDAVAIVWSDDPDEPATQVQLTGLGSVPELTLSPDPYDFGTVLTPCSEMVTVTLQNTGAEPLEVTSIDHESAADFELMNPNSLPLVLAVGETAEVDVVFTATELGLASGELVVQSNDPRGEVTSPQTGTGAVSAVGVDELSIPSNPPVDILFAIDQSCSMDNDTLLLGSNFDSFIDAIDLVTTDWQIGVANVDDGCFNSGILTPSTPDYQTVFSAAAVEGDDPGGTLTLSEKLLQLSDLALSLTDPGECNEGFLRPDAILHVIVVSDEPNRSSQPWATYQSNYEGYLSDPDLLTVSAVIDNSNCALGGTGYPDIVNATGGVILDLCGPWSASVGQLGQATIERVGTIQLSEPADPASVEVSSEGIALTTGWSYDEASNSVSFDPALGEGTSVTVDYAILATCD